VSEFALLSAFFLFAMAGVFGVCWLWVWRTRADLSLVPGGEGGSGPPPSWREQAVLFLRTLGETIPNPWQSKATLQRLLLAAGHRHPASLTVFYGIKWTVSVLLGLVLAWVGLLARQDAVSAILLAVCGLGFGLLFPDRVLESRVSQRRWRLELALPASLDLMVLSVEAGQSLDAAIFETSRELRDLYPDLSGELAQVQLELRAGRSRSDVLQDLGRRTTSGELKKLAAVLVDTDRFGTSLAPALRTHARYLRTRRRHLAQESARKLGVKLIFPVFFLIMPSVFVVTLGPSVLQIYRQVLPMMKGM
jgi:tight adherence protein C